MSSPPGPPPVGSLPAEVVEYEALRHAVGGRLVRRDALRLRGPDAASYLQGQCSQDVESMALGATVDALVLEPQGKLDALVRVVRLEDDDYLLDVEGGWGRSLRARLERFKLRVKVEIEDVRLQCLALRGPEAAGAAAQVPAQHVARFDWNGVSGVDLFGPSMAVPDGAATCGEGAWEALRVEAGIPAMGHELDGRTIAAEADLLERCVSFTKGCYTGQELVARLDARGNKVARHLVGLVVHAPSFAPGSLEGATTIAEGADGPEVGTVTSWARSPVLGTVALGYLHRRLQPPVAVTLRAPDGSSADAEARPLPLVGGGTS